MSVLKKNNTTLYIALVIVNYTVFKALFSKVTDIFVDKFDSESHYFPAYGLK